MEALVEVLDDHLVEVLVVAEAEINKKKRKNLLDTKMKWKDIMSRMKLLNVFLKILMRLIN